VPAAPELLEGGRRSATGRIRRGELDAAFFSHRECNCRPQPQKWSWHCVWTLR